MKSFYLRSFFIILTFCALTANLKATNNEDGQNVPRIVSLLPALVYVPKIEPSIPDDFIVMSPSKHISISDFSGIFWGPKDVLLNYFKDPKSLTQPIIKLRLDQNITQKGADSFSITNFEKYNPEMLKWEAVLQSYPVMAFKIMVEEKETYFALVGLNSPGQDVLFFELIYPDEKPSEEAIQLWENFLYKTKGLSIQDMLRAHGQDLQMGYTLTNVNGTQLKFIAEQRMKDDRLRIVVIPLAGNVQFKLDDVATGLMGLQWHYGEPLAKVKGTITAKNESLYGTVIQDQTTSILILPVQEYNLSEQEVKNQKGFILYEKCQVPDWRS